MGLAQPAVTPITAKGAQPAIVESTTPLDQRRPPTELAIASSKTLRTFVRDPIESTSATSRFVPILSEMESGDSDSSYWSLKSGIRVHKGFRYKSIKCDVYTILRRLKILGYYERLPKEPTSSTPLLLDQISAYLSRPPDNASLTQIRWLVLSGHHSNDEGFLIDRKMSFRWLKLRSALMATPQGVVVILVLACCEAEKAAREVVDNLQIPGLVVLASSAIGERSQAEVGGEERFDNGDSFLNAMVKVLKIENLQKRPDTWEDALELIAQELWKTTTAQHPVVCVKTDLPPSRALYPLAKPASSSTYRRGRSLPTTKGPCESAGISCQR